MFIIRGFLAFVRSFLPFELEIILISPWKQIVSHVVDAGILRRVKFAEKMFERLIRNTKDTSNATYK